MPVKEKHELLDVESAAGYLGVKPRMVRRLIESRAIPYHKVGALVRLSTADLDNYLNASRVEAGGAA